MDARRAVVCVTGASGFIGSFLVMKLLHHGYHEMKTRSTIY
jgi:nucleoside-diphosphate-sugar epimerase